MHFSFDFDFTLADSSAGAIECATHALRALGMDAVSDQVIRETIGLNLEQTFAALTRGRSDPSLVAAFKKHFIARADEVMLDHIEFFPSVPFVFTMLKRNDCFVSIVSTKFRARLTRALARDGLAAFVDHVVGGDEVTQTKPHPEGLLRAVAASGIAKSDTFYVGDSETDGECAARAGVGFIAVTTGTTGRRELERWSPHSIVPDLTNLVDSFDIDTLPGERK